jgi:tetratricopeptide (TPR) repeat protein
MAQVFLSYDRADAAKARSIAQALERAGHFVWWDFHIKGGAEYGKAIEEALAAADAVVVLWSTQSVDSAWVRDEAAAGRDGGRLVPVRLDDAIPPLGFRQYQNIDLRAWTGRRRPPVDGVLAAIDSVSKNQEEGQGAQKEPPATASRKPGRRAFPLLPAIAAALVMAAALMAFVWQPWRSKHDAPSVAVVPAERNETAGSLAADLLVKLGVLQSSHADALQLVDVDSRQTPDFIIKVGSAKADTGVHANLLLADNRTDTLLWSREFSEPGGNQADLRQQMAYSAAQVLDCAVQALGAKGEAIELPTLKLYLSGCADLSNLLAQDPRVAVSIFARVTAQAPKFKDGWKKLVLAGIQAFRFSFGTDPVVKRDLQKYAGQARRVDPAMGEAFLADAWLAPPRPVTGFMKLIDHAVAADPDNPEILAFQSIALTNVGRMQDALAATRRAVELNPLSPSARDALITALLNSGQVQAARNELRKSEQLWPGATNVLQSRFAVEFRVGDPRRAMQIMQSGELGAGYLTNEAHESYLLAKIEPTSKNKDLAVANARALYLKDPSSSWVYARALSDFGRHEELIDFLLKSDARRPYTTTWVIFRSSFFPLHNDPRFMVIAHRFGVADFWRDTGKWPDFCARSDLPYDCKAEVGKLS